MSELSPMDKTPQHQIDDITVIIQRSNATMRAALNNIKSMGIALVEKDKEIEQLKVRLGI